MTFTKNKFLSRRKSSALFSAILLALTGLAYLIAGETTTAQIPETGNSNLVSSPSFITGKYFGEGNEYGDFKTGDFNGDGKLDIAAVNSGDRISILLGNGDGSFNPPVSFTTELGPGQIAVADFNNDNKLDIAVVISGASVVAIHLGNGNGTFGLSDIYTTANNPQALVVKDFTGDGIVDIATINESGSISMLRSFGNGSFAIAINSTTIYGIYGSIVASDLDSDGDNDIMVATRDSRELGARSYANNGNGSFSAEMIHSVGGGTGALATGDFDSNGLIDVVSTPYAGGVTGDLSILQRTGPRFFTRRTFALANRDLSYGVAVGDFNGDGKDDTALTNGRTNNLSVYLNNGTADLFGVSTEYSIGAIGPNQGAGLGSGDFNNDGKIDLLAQKKGRFFLLINRGDGTFEAPFSASTDYLHSNTSYIALGNFDSDSQIDMVTSAQGGNNALRGGGQGKFFYINSFGLDNSSGYRVSRQVVPADFDNDGKVDVLDVTDTCTIFGCNSTSVTIHTGNGDGNFNVTNRSFTVGTQPISAVVGDFNSDGKLDAVVASYQGISGSNGSLSYLRGNGQGSFNTAVNYVVGGGAYWIDKGDFNGDGKLDVVVTRSASNDVAVLLNNGNGTFAAPTTFATGTNPIFVAVKDLNSDGKLDLVVSNADSNNISILLGTGNGTFDAATNFGGLSSPRQVAIADFNNDNQLDLAVANATGGFVSVLSGLGNATFSAPTNFQTDVSMSAIVAYDFNGDGKIDIATATANENKSDAITLLNNGNIPSSQSNEADVFNRPSGDGFVDSDDIQQIRRFSLGLDSASLGGEYQRADAAPRNTLGDGYVDSDDVVQARRYALGLDTLQLSGGPSSPPPIPPPALADNTEDESDTILRTAGLRTAGKSIVRTTDGVAAAPAAFRVDNNNTGAGSTLVVPIRVDTVGNEAGYTFSIAFDSTKLTNPNVVIGDSGGDVLFNANNAGQIGFSVTTFTGGTIAAGNNKTLVTVTFTVAAGAAAGTTLITFTDTPARRKASPVDPNFPITQPTYTGGTITIGGATAAGASVSGRVLTAGGRGISNARLTLTDQHGTARSAVTNSFGYFRFTDVPAGETCIISVSHKRYRFENSSQTHSVTGDNDSVIFQGEQR